MNIEGKKRLIGKVRMPGDKSISHRSIILGSISYGRTNVENILKSDDILNTINVFKSLGINIWENGDEIIIEGKGLYGLKPPRKALDCGNSGTTLRLMAGLLSGQTFKSQLIGDDSLNKRPMKRIIDPLSKMGANIEGMDNNPPLEIRPVEKLKSIEYILPVPSAQVKSSILLASLFTDGKSVIGESRPSRNHTEKILEYFGADIEYDETFVSINNPNELYGKKIYIPGDISSASYFIVAALILEGSEIIIEDVGLNSTRSGIIEVLKNMGGKIEILDIRERNNECFGDILVKSSELHGIEIKRDLTPNIIDEIPILAVAASFSVGQTIIRDVEELRHKETDRLFAISMELNKMGGSLKIIDNDLIINGVNEFRSTNLKSYNDHRIAMSLSIAALNTKGKSNIEESDCINISYPSFYEEIFSLIH